MSRKIGRYWPGRLVLWIGKQAHQYWFTQVRPKILGLVNLLLSIRYHHNLKLCVWLARNAVDICSSASKPDDDVVKSLALAMKRNDDVVEEDWKTPTDACWKTSALESLKCPELFVSNVPVVIFFFSEGKPIKLSLIQYSTGWRVSQTTFESPGERGSISFMGGCKPFV